MKRNQGHEITVQRAMRLNIKECTKFFYAFMDEPPTYNYEFSTLRNASGGFQIPALAHVGVLPVIQEDEIKQKHPG